MEKKLYTGVGDEQFAHPYIDTDEWREEPYPHRYIHGGFEGTQSKFCFYFPEKDAFKGRFFQHLMPMQGPETSCQGQKGEEDWIGFALYHGAYFIQTNMGGRINGGGDKTLMYRCSAQSAQYSRKLAIEMYGCERPYGYVFGGSGGGFKTMSCAECTTGIWDGAVPFVIGSPMAMPNVFTVRAHAMRILRNKMERIKDALEPGGGDPYDALNDEEADALREVTAMGFPPETWTVYESLGEGALPVLYPSIPAMDPTYFEDFWTKDGYLGAEPNGSAQRDRIHYETEIVAIRRPDTGLIGVAETIDEGNSYGVDEAWKHVFGKAGKMPVFILKDFPLPHEGDEPYTKGLTMRFLSGTLKGTKVSIAWAGGRFVTGESDTTGRDIPELLKQAKVGDKVEIDNSDYIAAQTYHRHQVPGPEYHAWDYFRSETGDPKYPQRPVLIVPIIARGGAGGVQEGTPNCKLIVLESHMDESAFPWQADWYRRKIMERSGTDGNGILRLWMMEHCMHTDCQEGNGGDHQHIVSYLGALHQALLDVSDWVERGIEPPSTTSYTMNGGQVILPESAHERGGIQPTVALSASSMAQEKPVNGKITVKVGEKVTFLASIALTKAMGDLESAVWDFTASDEFLPCGVVGKTEWAKDGTGKAWAKAEHTFTKPGIYFPVIKVASNRQPGDIFTSLRNQARIRVIVEE